MRRQRWTMLILISFVLISLTVLSSASWFIIFRKNQTVDFQYVQADTSPYFTTGGTYNGLEQLPTLTDEGKALYGEDFTFTLTWQSGVRADGTTAISRTDDEDYLGRAAGKHYYKIVDEKTGQVICQNHEVTIGKAALTATDITLSTVVLPGVAVPSYDFSWTGVNGETFKTTELSGETSPKNFSYGQIIYPVSVSVAFNSADVAAKPELEWHYNNYNEASAAISYSVVATCYSYTGSTATYHGSLDQALDATKDSAIPITVVAMQSFTANGATYTANPNATSGTKFTHTISDGKTVGANVTLSLPYTATTAFNASELTLDREGTTMSPTCVNKVTVGNLINRGTITIGGVLGKEWGGTSGATSGSYAMMYMNAGKTMTSTGDLNVFGYITNGGGTSNPAQIKANSGVISMPYVIYDYDGGGTTIGLFKAGNVAPFVIFDMPNVQAKLTCKGGAGGAKIVGYVDLYTGSATAMGITIPARHNHVEIDIFADAGALINMTSGEAEFWYKPTQGASFGVSDSVPNLASETDVVLRGDASSGSIGMVITVAIITESVALTDVRFPISHKFDLSLEGDYTYTFNSQFKFMPGSVLNIGEGANVVVESNAELMFYDAYSQNDGGTRLSYYNQVDLLKRYYTNEIASPAQCNVAGSLTVKGAIGGRIVPTSSSAFLDLAAATAMTVSEQEGNGSWSTSGIFSDTRGGSFELIYTETQAARGMMTDGTAAGSDSNFSDLANSGKNGYYSIPVSGTTTYGWAIATPGTITLDGGGGSFGSSTTATVNAYFDNSGGMVTPFASFTTPTWRDHRLVGWLKDGATVTESKVNSGDTLTADWEDALQIELTTTDPGGTVSATELVFIDEYYETVREYADYCLKATYTQYLSKWNLTLTHKTTNETVSFVLEPGEWFSPNVLATQFPDGADTNPANYTYALTPQMEDKAVVTLNVSTSNVTDTSIKVLVNGQESLSYSGSGNYTVYVRPQDQLSIDVSTKGAQKGGALWWKTYYIPTITISYPIDGVNYDFSASADSTDDSEQQTATSTQVIDFNEDGATTVTITCTGS